MAEPHAGNQEVGMMNRSMEELLKSGDALDVRKIGHAIQPGLFALDEFHEGKDYCDAEHEVWMWSIGRDKDTGDILASTTAEFYQHPDFECLWLR
jgi:hypothetical protein